MQSPFAPKRAPHGGREVREKKARNLHEEKIPGGAACALRSGTVRPSRICGDRYVGRIYRQRDALRRQLFLRHGGAHRRGNVHFHKERGPFQMGLRPSQTFDRPV